ncbi:MAG: DUF6266 family protein [Marinilabiliaceae bacterium]
MAKYNQGILGSFSGKVGSVVGSSWRGVSYIRARPAKVSNPRTAAQTAVRLRMATLTGTLKHFAPAIAAGFTSSGRLSPWSAAVKANMKALADGGDGAPVVDVSALALTDGAAEFAVKATKTSGSADFTWKAPRVADDFYGGCLYAVAYNTANAKAVTFVADLSAATASVEASRIATGEDDDIHILYFVATAKLSTPTAHLAL